MNIASTQFTLKHQSFEIYLSGCNGSCKGCCNPELKDFTIGTPYQAEINKIVNKIKEFDTLIKHIWILGGDPLDNDYNDLTNLILRLKPLQKQIWLWTRRDINHVPPNLKYLCDYIKCGEYLEELKCEDNIMFGIQLATSNQRIYHIKAEGYHNVEY